VRKKFSRGSSFWDVGAEKVISVTPADDGGHVLVCACSGDTEQHHVVTIQLGTAQALQFAKAIEDAASCAAENDE
jgi:hypothetical protein